MTHKIKLLVIDDSAVVRQTLTEILQNDPRIEFLGAAFDPIFAMRYMEKNWPNVIILDIEMPRMDGLTFLRKIMSERPTPVIICSTLTGQSTQISLEALDAGAVDIITKPKIGVKGFLRESSTLLIDAIRSAAQANLNKLKQVSELKHSVKPFVSPKLSADAVLPPMTVDALHKTTEHIVAVGTSAGGTQALEVVLKGLPRLCPGMVVVQHMPSGFTQTLAKRLDSICQINVKEAQNGDRIVPGLALIAPGNQHLIVKRSGAQYRVEVKDGPLVSRHRPSVDVLFRSVAQAAGRNAIGVIMTGMGDDGALGMKEMHEAGALTIAQDEASCVVYGMPKEAVKRGAVDHIVSLESIATSILQASRKMGGE